MRTRAFYNDSDGIAKAIAGFSRFVREQGLGVGVQENLDAMEAARLGCLKQRSSLRYSLKALYCTTQEDTEIFDRLFDSYWSTHPQLQKRKRTAVKPQQVVRKQSGSLVMLGKGNTEPDKEQEGKNVSGANSVERLRRTDFSQVSGMESEWLEELAAKLWKEMSLRLKRRLKPQPKGRIDLRRTLRKSLQHGGEPLELARKGKKPRKQRLIVLLDVSGSMDKYSFFLLRFLYALQVHFEQVESFTFSTSLTRITPYLIQGGLDATLEMLSRQTENWSSGTRLGASLQTFNQQYARRLMARSPLVIILSDGLDTGNPELLAREVEKIHRRAKRLIWLNPLKGMEGYEPIQKGMQAAMPAIDNFQSAHNLDSILELENFLVNV